MDLIPDEIMKIHQDKLNLLVFGYIGRVTKEFTALSAIPIDIVQLILALCPAFMDTVSSKNILMNIEKHLARNSLYHLESVKKLNLHSAVLDKLSQILLCCIIKQTKICTSYYKEILQHIITSFGEKAAIEGFILCWINDDIDDNDLYSFLHLITKYNALDLMKETIALFPTQYKVKITVLICK